METRALSLLLFALVATVLPLFVSSNHVAASAVGYNGRSLRKQFRQSSSMDLINEAAPVPVARVRSPRQAASPPTTTPAPGRRTSTPAPGRRTTTPSPGRRTTTPRPGRRTTTPRPGRNSTPRRNNGSVLRPTHLAILGAVAGSFLLIEPRL